MDIERHIAQRPQEIPAACAAPEWRRGKPRQDIAQGEVALALANAVALAQPFDVDYGFTHFSNQAIPCQFSNNIGDRVSMC